MVDDAERQGEAYRPDPVAYLQRAYEQTIEATSAPNDWQGTTTAAGAQLHYRRQVDGQEKRGDKRGEVEGGLRSEERNDGDCQVSSSSSDSPPTGSTSPDPFTALEPLLYVTNLGDSQVLVIRPSTREIVYKTTEQWHWFDCPRQLGTNSPDTPRGCAVLDEVPIQEGDVVLAMSDGVIDNLWVHEIVEGVCKGLERWRGMGREGRRVWAAGLGLGKEDGEEVEDGKGDWGGEGGSLRGFGEDDGGEVVKRGEKDGVGMEEKEEGEEEEDTSAMMAFVAQELMEAAKAIAVDPFAESPFMEHAIEEGLASGGGEAPTLDYRSISMADNGNRKAG